MNEPGQEERVLTPAEHQLLLIMASGRSATEAGEALGMTLAATAAALRRVRRQLGVNSTVAAIKIVTGSDL